MLKISDQLSLPTDLAGEATAILATRGAGKSFTSAVMAEEFWKSGVQFCVFDVTGVYWGLRAGADGGARGLPVIVLGGVHGDAPIAATAGRLIADVLVDTGQSLVLDLSDFTKGEQTRFVSDFADELFNRKSRERSTLHLILDEADEFCPQKPMRDETLMLGRVARLVAKGRSRGIGVTLITQRSATLNKNVLDLVDTLIAMRVLSPRDRKAIQGWIDYKQIEDDKGVVSSLPKLQTGQAWVWSPVRDTLKLVQMRRIETFDSYATPKPGKTVRQPKALAPVDIEKLGEQIKDTIEKAKADDPRELKRKIATLEKQLAARPKEQIEKVVEKIVEVPVLKNGQLDRTEKIAERLQSMTDKQQEFADKFLAETQELRRLISAAVSPKPVAAPKRPAVRQLAPASRPAPARRPAPQSPPVGVDRDPSLGKSGKRRMLAALAQYPQGMTGSKLSILTGIAKRGGTWRTYLGDLKTNGYVESRGDVLCITDAGLAAIGDYEPLPTGEALVDYWRGELGSSGMRTLFEAIIEVYPQGLTKSELAERTGIAEGGGTFRTYLGKLRTLELIEMRNGELVASDTFFE